MYLTLGYWYFIGQYNFGKKSIPREQPNQNKKMKIAVLLSLFMRDNEKCNISHAPSTGLSGI